MISCHRLIYLLKNNFSKHLSGTLPVSDILDQDQAPYSFFCLVPFIFYNPDTEGYPAKNILYIHT